MSDKNKNLNTYIKDSFKKFTPNRSDWLGQHFKIENCKYRVYFFTWVTCEAEICSANDGGYDDYILSDKVWIGNIITGKRLLKALGISRVIRNDTGFSGRVMDVVQKITMINKDDSETELKSLNNPIDFNEEIDIDTKKKLMIFNVNSEYCDKFIFRDNSFLYEFEYGKNKWTNDIKGKMKVSDILKKLEIKTFHKYDGGMLGGPTISYVSSIYFEDY